MIPGSLARRYARALLGLAETPAQRDRFADDMTKLAQLARQRDVNNISVLTTLSADRYPLSERRKLLETLARRVGADAMVTKFVVHVLERGRIAGLLQIDRAYRKMADEAAGRVLAHATSAKPLGPDAVAKLKRALEQATGKQVILETNVDPELIGGVVTRVGSYVLDGSVRSQLESLRTSLGG